MEDLVDDSLGVSFQFGVHGASLLLSSDSCGIFLSDRDEPNQSIALIIRADRAIQGQSNLRRTPPFQLFGAEMTDNAHTGMIEKNAGRPACPLADRRAPFGARADISHRLAFCTAMRCTSHPSKLRIWMPLGFAPNPLLRLSPTFAGWGSTGTKGRTSAGLLHHTLSLSVCRQYGQALYALSPVRAFIPAPARVADIERAASAPHAEDEGPTYAGTCAPSERANDARALGNRPFAWRFRVPAGLVSWNDLYLGQVELDPSQVGGDFIVARQNVGYSYQLAVVTDDNAMGISQVIRGMDLVPSTPRQILLYRMLGLPVPAFGHVALAVGPDGRRLAKRDGSLKLATLRAAGVDPLPTRWLARQLVRLVGINDRDHAARGDRPL